jgi:hypothetical protein
MIGTSDKRGASTEVAKIAGCQSAAIAGKSQDPLKRASVLPSGCHELQLSGRQFRNATGASWPPAGGLAFTAGFDPKRALVNGRIADGVIEVGQPYL